MAEPTYEELKARLSELEKEKTGRRGGQLEFRVGEKGGERLWAGAISGHTLLRTVGAASRCRRGPADISGREQVRREAQAEGEVGAAWSTGVTAG